MKWVKMNRSGKKEESSENESKLEDADTVRSTGNAPSSSSSTNEGPLSGVEPSNSNKLAAAQPTNNTPLQPPPANGKVTSPSVPVTPSTSKSEAPEASPPLVRYFSENSFSDESSSSQPSTITRGSGSKKQNQEASLDKMVKEARKKQRRLLREAKKRERKKQRSEKKSSHGGSQRSHSSSAEKHKSSRRRDSKSSGPSTLREVSVGSRRSHKSSSSCRSNHSSSGSVRSAPSRASHPSSVKSEHPERYTQQSPVFKIKSETRGRAPHNSHNVDDERRIRRKSSRSGKSSSGSSRSMSRRPSDSYSVKSDSGLVRRGSHRSQSHRANSVKSGTSPKHQHRSSTSKSKRRSRPSHLRDVDDASKTSHGSTTTYGSVFSATYYKVLGYLNPKTKPSKSRRKHKSSSPKQHHHTSERKKTSKHRSGRSKSKNRPDHGVPVSSSGTSSTKSISPALKRDSWRRNDEEAYLRRSNDEDSEEESSGCSDIIETSSQTGYSSACNSKITNESSRIGPHSIYSNAYGNGIASKMGPSSVSSTVYTDVKVAGKGVTQVYSGTKVATKGRAKFSVNSGDNAAEVSDLPWLDSISQGKMWGLYSGPVLIIPHGQGSLALEGNDNLKFYGRWVNGELVSQLMNDREDEPNVEYSEIDKKISFRTKNDQRSSRASSMKSDHLDVVISRMLSDDYHAERKDPSMTMPSPDIAGDEQSNTSQSQPSYALGQIARTPRDMIIHRSDDQAVQSASLLAINERAFIKRSNGAWTCALLADRSFQPVNVPNTRVHWHSENEIDHENMTLEESMLFVINEDGATKIIKMKHWGKFIRRIQTDDNENNRAAI